MPEALLEEATSNGAEQEVLFEFTDTISAEDYIYIDGVFPEKRRVFAQAYDKGISELVSQINEDILLPHDYENNYTWNDQKASLLIESILLNVPIPPIYVAEDEDEYEAEDEKWNVIDGLQRLYSLKRFFSNKFKLSDMEVFTALNGRYYKDLENRYKKSIDYGLIRIIVIFKESHPDVKYDVFMRLNTGSLKLHPQELRNRLYRGKLNKLIKELRNNKQWMDILGLKGKHKTMADAELVLRYLAISEAIDRSTFDLKDYPGSMKSFLNIYMSSKRNPKEEELAQIKEKFISTIDKVFSVFDIEAFRKINVKGIYDKTLNRAIMDTVMVCFEAHDKTVLVQHKNEIIKLLTELIHTDKYFSDSITIGTSNKKSIEYRLKTFCTKLNKILIR
ncbi:DUF262 domain-containing protein [Candidatus Magnetobacterium casense]|uniref:DUF262 domain-containing protein n=1 Tax=Candidatus Magnetobacterium casense TaxID=1455061 RepID=A0ABS6RYJ3_9BACT|nr:DUF262 domain-containing protein [Candidatus Magnetobacterium casensis]MBV6341676.1 DUF262 domain-containing protein [Candidatus Magnetobacterium casensis]